MLIVGAKGFAKEVLQILHDSNELDNLVFYDDVNKDIGSHLFGTFPIIKTKKEAEKYLSEIDNRFTIGIGNPTLRLKMYEKFIELGGGFKSLISAKANIGSYDVEIGDGVILMDGVNVSNSVSIGKGSMIYYNSNITHDCKIGEFVEIAPSVSVLGRVIVGDFCRIGANATVLPDVILGKHVTVGAGTVVTKNFPDYSVIAGVPAKLINHK